MKLCVGDHQRLRIRGITLARNVLASDSKTLIRKKDRCKRISDIVLQIIPTVPKGLPLVPSNGCSWHLRAHPIGMPTLTSWCRTFWTSWYRFTIYNIIIYIYIYEHYWYSVVFFHDKRALVVQTTACTLAVGLSLLSSPHMTISQPHEPRHSFVKNRPHSEGVNLGDALLKGL